MDKMTSLVVLLLIGIWSCKSYRKSVFQSKLVEEVVRDKLRSSRLMTVADGRSASAGVRTFFNHCRAGGSTDDQNFRLFYEKGIKILDLNNTPQKKDEAWRHSNLQQLFIQPLTTSFPQPSRGITKKTISDLINSDCQNSHMVFMNGKYSPELSDTSGLFSQIFLSTYQKCVDANQLDVISEVTDQFLNVPDTLEEPRDSYASDILSAINLMNFKDAVIVKVPASVNVSLPLQIIFYSHSDNDDSNKNNKVSTNVASFPRLYVQIGRGAVIEIRQSYKSTSADVTARQTKVIDINKNLNLTSETNRNKVNKEFIISGDDDSLKLLTNEEDPIENSRNQMLNTEYGCNFVSSITQIFLDENATLFHSYHQDLSVIDRQVEVLSAELSADSKYTLTAVQTGAAHSRLNIHAQIRGTGANCTVHGVMLCEQGQNTDIHTSIVHDAPESTSRQQQRMIVGERGKAVFKGRIRIPKHAQKTDSDQLCRSIMLGERAQIISMPTLEITADDVTCSHGASVADIDPNSIFYLCSRGLARPVGSLIYKIYIIVKSIVGALKYRLQESCY